MDTEKKILTAVVPCYNSDAYMGKCLNTLLSAGERIEILIVDDGSKDTTKELAEAYAKKYPHVKALHKENGGHGDAVNTGLANATGRYFKVIDSDDWVNVKAFKKVLDTLEKLNQQGEETDLLITNFVYNKQGVRRHKIMRYTSALPENCIFTWDDKMSIKKTQYILMHSVTYRTDLLREAQVVLPKHTFYVDNIFLYKPLPYVKKMMYLDVNLYQYFIGRADQSVNEKVMISRIDQQLRVNHTLFDIYGKSAITSDNLNHYMLQYMDIMMCVASIMLILAGDKESLNKKKELWQCLKQENPYLYKKMRTSLFGIWMNLPGSFGRLLSKAGYKVIRMIFDFN